MIKEYKNEKEFKMAVAQAIIDFGKPKLKSNLIGGYILVYYDKRI